STISCSEPAEGLSAKRFFRQRLRERLEDAAPRVVGADDETEVVVDRRDLRQNDLQALRVEVVLNEILRQDADACAREDALADRLDGSEATELREREARALRGVAPVTEEREVVGDLDERVLDGVLGRVERVLREERRRADEDVVLAMEAKSLELRI